MTISIGGNDLIEVLYEALEAALTPTPEPAADALLNGGSLDASVFETRWPRRWPALPVRRPAPTPSPMRAPMC